MIKHVFRSGVGALARRATSVSVSHNDIYDIIWDDTVFDTNQFWSSTANPERLTVPTGIAGDFYICGGVGMENGLAGVMHAAVRVCNNSGTITYQSQHNEMMTAHEITGMEDAVIATLPNVPMSGGDYAVLTVYQNGGIPKQLNEESTFLGIFRMDD